MGRARVIEDWTGQAGQGSSVCYGFRLDGKKATNGNTTASPEPVKSIQVKSRQDKTRKAR